MPRFYFVSDLHGKQARYEKLADSILNGSPDAVFIGGDLLPWGGIPAPNEKRRNDFIDDYLAPKFGSLKKAMGGRYPRVLVIMGNDDVRIEEKKLIDASSSGIWDYVHNTKARVMGYTVYGYAHVPPTPFRLKDWERYDVSRFVDMLAVAPEDGIFTVPVSKRELLHTTIMDELRALAGGDDMERAIFLFHAPPYNTNLDRAALDGAMVNFAPVDTHVGSIAIRQFIESRQPLAALHGHIHESARITGAWRDTIGRTQLFSAAHDGAELALVEFDPDIPEKARRVLL